MMLVVDYFMVRTLNQRKKFKNFFWRNGPMLMLFVATPMVMAEPTRHVMGDTGAWLWCGDNAVYPRVNQTWNTGCDSSSTEYACDIPCCIPESELNSDAMYPMSKGTGPNGTDESTVPYHQLADLYPNISQAYGIWHDHKFPQLDLADPKWNGAFAVKNATTGETTYECSCQCTLNETMGNLSGIGWLFTFSLTYLGFALLAVGSLWNADIISKCKGMKKKWNQLRAAAKKSKEQRHAQRAGDLEQPLTSSA